MAGDRRALDGIDPDDSRDDLAADLILVHHTRRPRRTCRPPS